MRANWYHHDMASKFSGVGCFRIEKGVGIHDPISEEEVEESASSLVHVV